MGTGVPDRRHPHAFRAGTGTTGCQRQWRGIDRARCRLTRSGPTGCASRTRASGGHALRDDIEPDAANADADANAAAHDDSSGYNVASGSDACTDNTPCDHDTPRDRDAHAVHHDGTARDRTARDHGTPGCDSESATTSDHDNAHRADAKPPDSCADDRNTATECAAGRTVSSHSDLVTYGSSGRRPLS